MSFSYSEAWLYYRTFIISGVLLSSLLIFPAPAVSIESRKNNNDNNSLSVNHINDNLHLTV